MKSVAVSLFLVLVMAAYLIIPVIPVIDYLVNKDYIAKNLCINKDKPKSCCQGKCHLVTQLQKTNQKTKTDPNNSNSRIQLKDLNEFMICRPDSFTPQEFSNKYLISNILTADQLVSLAFFVPPKHFPAFI